MEGSVFDLEAITGFDWDEGNKEKNWIKHGVDYRECEEVFFNRPLIIGDEIEHSAQEKRYFVLGRSNAGKTLFLAFTIRKDKVRVITAVISPGKRGRYMSSNRKPIPAFTGEDEEREFWSAHDSTDYIDWSKAVRNPVLPNLKPSTRTVSIRLPESLIAELKALANKRDVPYQSLMKIFLAEKVKEETAPYKTEE
jgi:uncharacterized DUF497 family protein/predicted DNA binding CopG/RHH family protein